MDKPRRILKGHRIILTKLIQIDSAFKPYRVFADPAAGIGVVPAAAELDEAGVGIVETALKTEWLEAGVGVAQDTSEGVVVEALHYLACFRVNDKPHRTLVVGDDAVGDAIANHVRRGGRAVQVIGAGMSLSSHGIGNAVMATVINRNTKINTIRYFHGDLDILSLRKKV